MPAISSNNLPSGYTELEYLHFVGENDGRNSTTYIDTGIKLSNEHIIKIKTKAYNFTGLMGRYSDSTSGFQLFNEYYRFGNFRGIWNLSQYANQIHTFAYGQDGLYVDNTLIATPTTNTFTQSSTCLIGSIGTNDSTFVGDVYEAWIEKSGEIIGHYVPCKHGSELGLYDTVSGNFLQNAGSGDFIAGPAAIVQIATTKYVETAFADSVSELNTTIVTIKNVVDNTIIQADRIGKLATGKQTRPTGSCPEGRMCLLITEADGTLRWYPICGGDGSVEPFNANAFLTAFSAAGNPTCKVAQDSEYKDTYYNAFYKGISAWRQQYVDGSTSTYDRPFAHATRCTSPNYTTNTQDASPCYTENGMYKTLTDGEWAVVYEGDEKANSASTTVDPGVIYGISKCVSTNLTGNVSSGTKATAAQLADPLFSGIPINQTDGANYKQCWCKMTAIGLPGGGSTTAEKAANGGIASVSGTSWIFSNKHSSAADCAYDCAHRCVYYFRISESCRSAVVSTNN